MLTAATDQTHPRMHPLILHDLDKDGLSEIILGGLNRIYWNQGGMKFKPGPLLPDDPGIFDAAILADFTGDGWSDFVCVARDRKPRIYNGGPGGTFESEFRNCADFGLEFPKVFTAGDIDADGDLDLFIGQYKFPYLEGSMPTPFYDCNDGHPSVLLENDGTGNFTDITERAGLAAKRNRRIYSGSLVDLDADGDLDLLQVCDFSGVDVFANQGAGRFEDVTGDWIADRHLFGMAHTLADFNLDGVLDFYAIGMSSTTARRLDRMNLGRDDHPDITGKRMAMAYGNRMYLGQAGKPGFQAPEFADQVARTGWSWGVTAPDIDLDGDPDLFVVNGHESGKSARDYCTTYWTHDNLRRQFPTRSRHVPGVRKGAW